MTDMLNPLESTARIADNYRRYLLTTFRPRDRKWQREFRERLTGDFSLSKGPYLEASAPFMTGASVDELVAASVLAPATSRLSESGFPTERALYVHQERAIRKAVVDRRNLVIASGTGSGKTEAFLLPILNSLVLESLSGTIKQSGVRALLLYPMNALANDQLKRLRVLLRAFPEITFGRYVGETHQDRDKAEDDFRKRWPFEPRLPNELISRDQMQSGPPHILLTNYAMLEYLLLRPQDSAFFDGDTARHWRTLVLDEVHIYNGARGTEIAMLLRRVRDRVLMSERGRLQCFATSATLGGGEEDYPALAQFASDLFGEDFEWNARDERRQDIIGAVRRPLAQAPARYRIPPSAYGALQQCARSGGTVEALSATLSAACPDVPRPAPNVAVEAFLWDLLKSDEHVARLHALLETTTVDLRSATSRVLGPEGTTPDLVSLVDLAVLARRSPEDASLLPARYHFMLRALEGSFVCLHPEHPAGEPAMRLSRFEHCPSCARHGRLARMFELGVCRRCGAEYVTGGLEQEGHGHVLKPAPAFDSGLTYLLLGGTLADTDEDELATNATDDGDVSAAALCVGCGSVLGSAADGCECPGGTPRVAVTLASVSAAKVGLRRCPACSGAANESIVYRFLTGADAPLSVIATDLYQSIPPSHDASVAQRAGQGRKLLVFSDSRQDAAFFAPYLELTYRRAVQRRLIADAVISLGPDRPRFEDLVRPIKMRAEDCAVLDPDAGGLSNATEVRVWLMRELLAVDRRQSLDGTGTAELAVAFPRNYQPPPQLLGFGLDAQSITELLRVLIDTVRAGGAVSVAANVDIQSEAFAPRNLMIGMRGQQSESGVLAWLPSRGSNRRLDIVQRVFARRGATGDPKQFLSLAWEHITRSQEWSKVLVSYQDGAKGVLWRLDHERFEWLPATEGHRPLVCGTCRQLWWHSVDGVCNSYRCTGTLKPVDPDHLADDHYGRLYRELAPIGISVEEHTAQWKAGKASSLQDAFVRGDVNVLSCSTTFELGVDVGEVQAVLLRNVPPGPANYIQRAGRAGRRTDSAALVVTFAQRRNHDLYYFQDPSSLIDGTITPPFIRLNNAAIARRHAHAIAFAAFERLSGAHRNVGTFFLAEGGTSACELFVNWLNGQPKAVQQALARVLPPEVASDIGVADWSWVSALAHTDQADLTHGWLERASEEVRDDLAMVNASMEEAVAKQQFSRAEMLKRLKATIAGRQTLGFLASRNVLPKYGFPVDVVELTLSRTGDADALNLELQRDLRLAISEYAPGARVIAGKALWASQGLVIRPNRELRKYEWAVCGACGAARHQLIEVAEQCNVCGSTETARRGRFVIPEFGFVGKREEGRPGESRPARNSSVEWHFGVYQQESPEFESVDGFASEVRRRHFRQGRITVVNRGPGGRGFRICEWCGYGTPAPATATAGQLPPHKDIRRPDRECKGHLSFLHLGHEFLTDVVEVVVPGLDEESVARSVLYALLESAPRLGISRDDVDGTVGRVDRERLSLVLFDTVPGGAGHARRLGDSLPQLIGSAIDRTTTCECGEDTSCYSCLRSYSNQLWHEQLSRGVAAKVLRGVAGRV